MFNIRESRSHPVAHSAFFHYFKGVRTMRCFELALIAALAVLTLGSSGRAEVIEFDASFDEVASGPTDTNPDTFTVTNSINSSGQITSVTFDLSGSAGGLVFDLAALGGGTDPGHDFATADAATTGFLSATVADGGTSLVLTFDGFDPGETFTFTIDVDNAGSGGSMGDINNRRQVLGSEFAGTTISALFDGPFVGGPQSVLGTFEGVGQTADLGDTLPSAEVVMIQATPAPEPLSALVWIACALGFVAYKRRDLVPGV